MTSVQHPGGHVSRTTHPTRLSIVAGTWPASALSLAALPAAAQSANAAGGIGGRPVKLVTADDAGKRDAVLANARKLVEADQVIALIGSTSGAGTEGSLAYTQQAAVPILSPATGNMGIRDTPNAFIFHTRAGYDDEMNKIVGHVA